MCWFILSWFKQGSDNSQLLYHTIHHTRSFTSKKHLRGAVHISLSTYIMGSFQKIVKYITSCYGITLHWNTRWHSSVIFSHSTKTDNEDITWVLVRLEFSFIEQGMLSKTMKEFTNISHPFIFIFLILHMDVQKMHVRWLHHSLTPGLSNEWLLSCMVQVTLLGTPEQSDAIQCSSTAINATFTRF